MRISGMKAAEGLAGRKVRCGKCGHAFAIAATSVDDADFQPLDSLEEAPVFSRSSAGRASENRRARGQNYFHVATIVLALLSCLAVGAAVVIDSRPTPAPAPNADWRMNLPGVGKPEQPDAFADSALSPILLLVGLAWMVWLVVFCVRVGKADARTSKARAAQTLTHGPIVCNFCETTVVQDAKWLGQTIICPNCHGTFSAPGGKKETSGASSAWTALGILMLVCGLIGILSGGGLWAYALFGFGIGCVSKGRFWFFFWVT